jgi:ATP-dependent DNA helicase RecG
MNDLDLLDTLGVIRNRKLTLAGLQIAGKEEAIREHLPGYGWTHLRMRDDTQYTDRMDGRRLFLWPLPE